MLGGGTVDGGEGATHLDSQLSCWRQDECKVRLRLLHQLLQDGQGERPCLAAASLSQANHIFACDAEAPWFQQTHMH